MISPYQYIYALSGNRDVTTLIYLRVIKIKFELCAPSVTFVSSFGIDSIRERIIIPAYVGMLKTTTRVTSKQDRKID